MSAGVVVATACRLPVAGLSVPGTARILEFSPQPAEGLLGKLLNLLIGSTGQMLG